MTRELARRWYKTPRWKKARAAQLAKQPFCQCPEHEGKKVKADTVDHITPHRGNARLFWDASNHQSLTRSCHSSWKQRMEGGRYFDKPKGCDESGWPNDPAHFWRKQ